MKVAKGREARTLSDKKGICSAPGYRLQNKCNCDFYEWSGKMDDPNCKHGAPGTICSSVAAIVAGK